MSVIFDQYEERLVRLRRNRQTISNFRKARRHFDNFLEEIGTTADQVEPWMVEEHFAGLPLAPNTVRTYFQQIKAAYRYALKRRVLHIDPTVDVQLPKVPDTEPVIIPNAELRRIKQRAWTDRQWIIFHLLAYGGLRLTEVLTARGEDVNLEDSTLRVIGKFGKLRNVPLHPALNEAIVEHCCFEPGLHLVPGRGKDGRLSQGIFYRELREIAPEWTPHDFRRTVATSLARNDVPERVIDRIMGWGKRGVRDRYYVNVAPVELQRGILKLYADDPV